MRAFWNYWLTVNLFNLPACIIISFISGFKWLPVMFCSFGLGLGLVAFNLLYKQQYYFYYNLGFTKLRLSVMMLTVNAIAALPVFLISLLF